MRLCQLAQPLFCENFIINSNNFLFRITDNHLIDDCINVRNVCLYRVKCVIL